MLTQSSAFDNAITPVEGAGYKPRYIKGKIVFEQVDTTAQPDATTTASSTHPITAAARSTDGVRITKARYASFETGRTTLGGSFIPVPSSGYANVGWWSQVQSNASKVFSPAITVQALFSTNHTSSGISIIWDDVSGEHATDFIVTFYNSSDVVIHTITELANTLSEYVYQGVVTSFRKIIITINKWSKATRYARIQEILFGVLATYDSSSLGDMSMTEEMDIASEELTKNILQFSINNVDQAYDPINPTGVYQYLQKRQQIAAYLGCQFADGSVEYAPMGVFYLVGWTTSRTGDAKMKTSFTAHDKLEILDVIYRKGLLEASDIGTLITAVLTEAGLAATDYNIDAALFSIPTYTILEVKTCRELLHELCVAGMAVARADRYGVIQVYQETIGVDVLELSSKVAQEPEISLLPTVYDVIVTSYTYSADAVDSQIYKAEMVLSGTQTIVVEYDNPALYSSYTFPSVTVVSSTFYSNAAVMVVTYTGTATLTIQGKKYTKSATPVTVVTGELDGETLKIDIPSIGTRAHATNVANWLIATAARRKELTVNWKQNPALEVGDEVSIDTQFGTVTGCTVVSNSFSFTGGLNGTTKGRVS